MSDQANISHQHQTSTSTYHVTEPAVSHVLSIFAERRKEARARREEEREEG